MSSSGNRGAGTLADGIRRLVGQPLASIEFVQDYVQLHFDGPTLTAYTLPVVNLVSSVTLVRGQTGWRDALCAQIGSVVCRTEVEPDYVSLAFENGAVVEVSLRDEEYRGPEALQFSLDAEHIWVV